MHMKGPVIYKDRFIINILAFQFKPLVKKRFNSNFTYQMHFFFTAVLFFWNPDPDHGHEGKDEEKSGSISGLG
jgi:hypothetical protein